MLRESRHSRSTKLVGPTGWGLERLVQATLVPSVNPTRSSRNELRRLRTRREILNSASTWPRGNRRESRQSTTGGTCEDLGCTARCGSSPELNLRAWRPSELSARRADRAGTAGMVECPLIHAGIIGTGFDYRPPGN
jgi:hypothetical protein